MESSNQLNGWGCITDGFEGCFVPCRDGTGWHPDPHVMVGIGLHASYGHMVVQILYRPRLYNGEIRLG
ncbi:hypothetical protein [Paenibacillus sp. FSL K6-0108]|uniref:hypothetical protein n=1 Tax=Paenibacillus sp. FSL K6-0108 TaxID=2921417 RepID=UPI003247DC10